MLPGFSDDEYLLYDFWAKKESLSAPGSIKAKNKSLSAVLLGGGAARRGTERPGMKKVLLGESEVFY